MSQSVKPTYNPLTDFSFWTLVGANIFTVYWLLANDVNFFNVILVYFGQTMLLTFSRFVEILVVPGDKEYKDKVRAQGYSSLQLFGYRLLVGLLAISPILFFHLLYAIFIFVFLLFNVDQTDPNSNVGDFLDWDFILPALASFGVSQIITLLIHFIQSFKDYKFNYKGIFYRLLPMHFIIIIGGTFVFTLGENVVIILIFLLIKIAIDLLVHIQENKPNKESSETKPESVSA